MSYELWRADSLNCQGVWPTLDAALRAIAADVARGGEGAYSSAALAQVARGRYRDVAAGPELVELARAHVAARPMARSERPARRKRVAA